MTEILKMKEASDMEEGLKTANPLELVIEETESQNNTILYTAQEQQFTDDFDMGLKNFNRYLCMCLTIVVAVIISVIVVAVVVFGNPSSSSSSGSSAKGNK